MYRCLAPIALVLLIGSAPLTAQNLLVNPSFDDPPLSAGDCSQDSATITGWTGANNKRNGDLYVAPCPRDGDVAHLSLQNWGFGSLYAAQTVTVTPGQLYTLAGWWFKGHDQSGQLICTAELRNGPAQDSPLIASKTVLRYDGEDTAWSQFSVNGTPTGSVMTVVIRGNNAGSTGWALHVDDCQLVQGTCVSPPTIGSVSPAHGVRGTAATGVQVSGANFVAGSTSVKLTRGDGNDINATNVSVTGTASLTCDFNLATAVLGPYSVVVSVTGQGCPSDTLSDGFLVILPAFTNGSFELPSASGGCPPTPLAGIPTDWSYRESAGYGFDNAFYRDSNIFTPSCPPIDGVHYASSSSTNNGQTGAVAQIYQTFAVTPGTTYSFSGYFAGGGANTVGIELRDGAVGDAAIQASTIHTPVSGNYDWTFATVTGVPSGNMMTAVWQIHPDGPGPHAAHADGLAVEVCSSPIVVGSITPRTGINTGPISITNLAGGGFVVGGSPIVQLIKGNTIITATGVTVVSPTQMTCTFDLTGAPSGKYMVQVKQGGCSDTIPTDDPAAFQVVASQFVNGDFEDPSAPQNCGPPPTPVGGIPTGWNADINMSRDGNAPVPPSCPSPAGGHYATMSTAGYTLRAWQTVKVIPGQLYTFSGQFAGSADCIIKLLDGDENGMTLASTAVFTGGDGGTWHAASVQGTAVSSVMTVMWTIQNTAAGSPGGHADGLQFASNCHVIWADADDDGDVDMNDFAMWQRCLTVSGGQPIDPYCLCFDRADPIGRIDEFDFPAFEHCVSGPSIPWTSCAP